MRRVLTTILFTLCLVGPSAGVMAFGHKDVLADTLASIVRIDAPAEDGGTTTCTGFVVSPHRALTVSHCVPEDVGFTVDGVQAMVMRRGDRFAMVTAPGSKPALKIGNKLALQEAVTTFGYAWGEIFVFGRRVAKFQDGDFAMDGPLAPGMSGGPTVNAAGKVVGINQAANAIIGIDCGAGEILEFLIGPPSPK